MLEKIKNFFKWLWGNKQALTSIVYSLLTTGLVNYALFSDLLLQWDFFARNTLALQIAGGILTGLCLVNLIYTIANKYGLENLGEISNRIEAHKLAQASRLTKEQKEAIKAQYRDVDAKLKVAEEHYGKLTKIISNFNALSSISGYSIPEEKIKEYNNANQEIDNAKIMVESYKKSKEELHNALKK